jgi:peptide chain release factor subunit 1
MDKNERYRLQQEIERISQYRGRATELVSLYVPPTKLVSDVASYLRNELSQSANIKSKSTKKNVQSAVESILARLKTFKVFPTNGVVFFVGNVSMGSNQSKMEHVVLEPPVPIQTFRYRCESKFLVDDLRSMCVGGKTYALIVIDRSDAAIGVLKDNRTTVIKEFYSLVPSKHHQGGQSAQRFERIIEGLLHKFFSKIGDSCTDAFLDLNVDALIVGGPGSTKDDFVKGNYLHHELKKKLIDTFDTCYTNSDGIPELVSAAEESLKDLELMEEKELMNRFMVGIAKDQPVTYGNDVLHALQMGAVDILLVSLSADPGKVDEFSSIANDYGTRIEYISTGFYEGDTLLSTFGGFGAILRFKI